MDAIKSQIKEIKEAVHWLRLNTNVITKEEYTIYINKITKYLDNLEKLVAAKEEE